MIDEAGKPFPRVIINIQPVNGDYDERRQTITDDEGSFSINGLTPRAYDVTSEASGYVEADNESSAGYHVIGENLTLKLRKGAVITGKATDESGEPLVQTTISIQRVRDGEGRRLRVAQHWNHVKTDDRGIYRAFGLEGGSYILSVDKVGQYEEDEHLNQPATYYPSSTADDAQEVAVTRGGEATGIDIVRREMRGHAVSGKCSGALNKRSKDEAYVMLVHPKTGIIETSAWQGYEQNRAFSFYGVPDGDYYVIAKDDYDEPGAASMPLRIKVAGSDVTGIELKLIPLGSITGRVVVESDPRFASSDCKSKHQLNVQEVVARAFRSADNTPNDLLAEFSGTEKSSPPDENAKFVLDNLATGRYRVGIDMVSEDFFVRSITRVERLPERRIPANSLTIKSGEDIKNIVITISDGAAGIRGRIVTSDQTAKLPSGLRVHLVPAEPEAAADGIRDVETDTKENGEFSFANVAPGRYWLLARISGAIPTTSAPEATEAMMRARLRTEALASNNSIELRPCQRTTNYLLRYAPSSPGKRPN